MTPKGTPGRELQAAILRRMRYDMRRYQIVNEYLERRRKSIVRESSAAKKRLDTAGAEMVAAAGERLDRHAERAVADLDALRLDVAPGPQIRKKRTQAFSDTPDFLKSFSNFF